MAVSNNGGERYERYNFNNVTEDDHIVSNILVNFETLINRKPNSRNSSEPPTWASNSRIDSYEPTWVSKSRNSDEPTWSVKRKRSALDSPPPLVCPSPPLVEKSEGNKQEKPRIRDSKNKEEYSPLSILGYEPNEGYDNKNYNYQSKHQLRNKSRKRKLEYWEQRIKELEQTKQQLKLSLDNVKKYHRTLLEFNVKLKAKRDEKNSVLKRENRNPPLQINRGFDLNLKTGQHEFPPPIFARQQQQKENAFQQRGITLQYCPVPYFQANNNDKLLRAAEARHRRKIKINTKKNSLGIRSSII